MILKSEREAMVQRARAEQSLDTAIDTALADLKRASSSLGLEKKRQVAEELYDLASKAGHLLYQQIHWDAPGRKY